MTTNQEVFKMMSAERDGVASLVKAGETEVLMGDNVPEGCVKTRVSDDVNVGVRVIGLIDIKLELARLNKVIQQKEGLMQKLAAKMDMPDYMTKVPEKVRNDNKEKMDTYTKERDEAAASLEIMKKFE